MKDRVVRAFLIEEQKIVKKVCQMGCGHVTAVWYEYWIVLLKLTVLLQVLKESQQKKR